MKVAVQRLPKNTIKLTITVENEKVKDSRNKIFNSIAENIEIDGFRKGKAPLELVEQKIDKTKLDSEVISDLIKTYYPQALKEQNIDPIISPAIQIESFNVDGELTFTAETAVKPKVVLGDYRTALKEVYNKKVAELPKPTENQPDRKQVLTPNDVIGAVISVTETAIPDMVVEEEVNKMLSRLVNQVQAIKLDMEAYLKSINKSADGLRQEYTKLAENNITGELALIAVAEKEDIPVEDSEVNATIHATGDAKIAEHYNSNPLEKAYIKSIIAKNKVIWKLISELESDTKPEPAKSAEPEKKEANAKN